MKCLLIFIVLLTIKLSSGVIYRLNDTEYLRMPPVYHLDEYDSCLYQPNGTYCYVEMDLVSDTPSDLIQMIREYSEHTTVHFNHTRLHRGICLTKTCKHLLQQNEAVDTKLLLERCLNESLWRDYKLKTKLSNMISCKKLDDPMIINIGDIVAAVVFVCIGLLNIIGSLYDYWFIKGRKGNRILLSFSFKRNFEKLMAHGDKDPLREKLKGIHGLRVLSVTLVIFAHAPLPFIISTENSHGLEKNYYNIIYHLFYNGTLIVQTFFIVTGFLMAYNIRTYSEKNEINWVLIPKGIITRWLRLTPAYAVVLLFTLTWIRFVASGPLWQVTVGVEVADCHRFGWLNIIYLNNYIDNSQCMPQTWYLAADMQLYVLGLFVCILTKTSKCRNFVLSTFFVIGFVIPAVHTYVQDLDAIVIVAPEIARNFFITDSTFNHAYKRGHTNIPGIVLGLALGNLVYKGLRDEGKQNKYKNLGFFYYLTVPIGIALVLSGMLFYGDYPRPSIYLRTVLAAVIRPLFALLVTIFFIGMIFKFENLYRKIVEWHWWRTPARVSYSAFLVHLIIIRIFAGTNSTLSRMGLAQCFKEAFGIISMTFLIAYPFWLFVESPLNQASLIIFGLSKEAKTDNENQKMDNRGERIKHGTVIGSDDNNVPAINSRL